MALKIINLNTAGKRNFEDSKKVKNQTYITRRSNVVTDSLAPPKSTPTISPNFFKRFENDPQFVYEYADHIFEHLCGIEKKHRPIYGYMKGQVEIDMDMRAILLDWLIDVSLKFKMKNATAFLAKNILDRYLSYKVVKKTHLQLVGITSFFIAAKYEEVFIPSVSDLVSICAYTYENCDIIEMEKKILRCIGFRVTCVTPYHFFSKLHLLHADIPIMNRRKIYFITHFLAEMSLLKYEFLGYKPSIIASSCAFLASKLVLGKRFVWKGNFEYFSKYMYKEHQLKKCCSELIVMLKMQFDKNNKYTAVRRKYSSGKRDRVSYLIKKKLKIKIF